MTTRAPAYTSSRRLDAPPRMPSMASLSAHGDSCVIRIDASTAAYPHTYARRCRRMYPQNLRLSMIVLWIFLQRGQRNCPGDYTTGFLPSSREHENVDERKRRGRDPGSRGRGDPAGDCRRGAVLPTCVRGRLLSADPARDLLRPGVGAVRRRRV